MTRNLEVRNVKGFAGIEFYIPAYQRGYRWREAQTRQLLCDIEEARIAQKPYLLQPIVLKRRNGEGEEPESYEVIDGQQRLTTIWLILQFIQNGGWRKPEKYRLVYETEADRPDFLNKLGTPLEPETMDEAFFVKSYETIDTYFKQIRDDHRLDEDAFGDHIRDFCKFLQEHVQVIWYEVEAAQAGRDGEEIFMSLNRGRIPLESSELIKTLLLVKASRVWEDMREDTDRQTEIATEWDEMERALSDPEFWAFIGGDDGEAVGKPRIGYFLEMLPPPPGIEDWKDQEGDDYKVFNRYEALIRNYDKENDVHLRPLDCYVLEGLWREHIRANFLKLKDWAKNVRLFHKIGFLIAVKRGRAKERMALLTELLKHEGLKSELEDIVDAKIRALFSSTSAISDLDYARDKEAIYKLLLLFNVISCMQEAAKPGAVSCEWYSFARHAAEDWSIEHINPQRELAIIGSGDRAVWVPWLEGQRPFLKLVKDGEELAAKTEAVLRENAKKLDGNTFSDLSKRIVEAFSKDFDEDSENALGNLALLSRRDNSSIGASIFLRKRQEILEKISNGRFVPFCTRQVFLKYYTKLDENKEVKPEAYGLVFWTRTDAALYLARIKEIVEDYLPKQSVEA